MASVDRSLVGRSAAVRGTSRRASSTRSCARRARSRYPKEQRGVRAGRRRAFLLRAAARPCARRARPRPTGEQVVVRYVSPGEIFGVAHGDRAARPIRPPRPRSIDSVVLVWPSAAWPRLVAQLSGARHQHAADRRQPAAGDPHPRGRDVDRAGRAARRACAAAACQAVRPQGRARRRDRLSDQPPGHRRDDRHDAAHRQPHPERAGSSQGLVESGRQRIVLRDPHKLFGSPKVRLTKREQRSRMDPVSTSSSRPPRTRGS